MKYWELIKKTFEKETSDNFVMYLMRIDGVEYAKFFNLKDPKDMNEWENVVRILSKQSLNTVINLNEKTT